MAGRLEEVSGLSAAAAGDAGAGGGAGGDFVLVGDWVVAQRIKRSGNLWEAAGSAAAWRI